MKALLVIATCLLACQCGQAQEFTSARPAPEDRCFSSEAVERTISEVSSKLTNPKLAWMFSNCFPNTIDTTVEYDEQAGDTFVITGDIHAMWLRDSGAQVWPYLRLAGEDEHLRKMLAGVLMRQFRCIAIDPYANAFNKGPSGSKWESDITQMNPWLHERKWEVDSPCYVLRLAHGYWKATGDTSVFGDEWLEAVRAILRTFREQQRYDGQGPYSFMRRTPRGKDTKSWGGFGAPVRPCGLICSSFRPSDDASVLEFLIPSNFFAVSTLRNRRRQRAGIPHPLQLLRGQHLAQGRRNSGRPLQARQARPRMQDPGRRGSRRPRGIRGGGAPQIRKDLRI